MTNYYFISDLVHNIIVKNSLITFLKRNKIKLKKKRKHCVDNRVRDCLVISIEQIDLALKINKSKSIFSQDITDTLEMMKETICQIESL